MRSLGGWQLDDFWYSPHTQGFLRKIKTIGAIALPDIQKRMTDGKYAIIKGTGDPWVTRSFYYLIDAFKTVDITVAPVVITALT